MNRLNGMYNSIIFKSLCELCFSIIKAVEQEFIFILNDAELAGESLAIELSDTAREIPFAIVNQDTRFVSS